MEQFKKEELLEIVKSHDSHTELQKVGILISRIPDISAYLSISDIKRLPHCCFMTHLKFK